MLSRQSVHGALSFLRLSRRKSARLCLQVVFDVDADGLLRVAATDKASGHSRQATAWDFNLYGTPTGVSDNSMGGGE